MQTRSSGSWHARMQAPRGGSPGGRKPGPGLGQPPLHLPTSRTGYIIHGAQGKMKMPTLFKN